MRNRLWFGAAAACAALAVPASALAATQLSIKPSITGKLGGNGAIAFTLSNANTIAGLPAPLQAPFVAHLPAGIGYNVGGFGTCSPAVVGAATGSAYPNCPPSSLIGKGSAQLGASLGSSQLSEHATVRIYLIRKSPVTVEFWANGTTPIEETLHFTGTLTRDRAPYGEKLTVQVPTIPTVSGGPDASTVTFTTIFSATRKVKVKQGRRTVTRTIGEFTLPKKCKSLRWAATATYQDGTNSSASATTACPRR
jgi:hypothetical protein